MKSKDLAAFHSVHERTTRKWSQEQRHRRTIQAEADVTPLEWRLVGEISQLVYLYNAQNWFGENPTRWAWFEINSIIISVSFFEGMKGQARHIMQAKTTAEMQLIKMQLEQLVY